MRQSCGMDVEMSLRKGIKLSAQKSCKVNQSFQRQPSVYTDLKLNEMKIMSLNNQVQINMRLFMYRVLSNEAPEYISNLYTHTLPHAIPTLGTITLVCLGQG